MQIIFLTFYKKSLKTNYVWDLMIHIVSLEFWLLLYFYCSIRRNTMHPLNGALPGPYVPLQVTRGALVAHRYTYVPPRCRTCSTAGLLFSSQCPSGTILLTSYSIVSDWRVSRAGPMIFNWPKLPYHYYSLLLFFPFSSLCL